MSFADLTSEHLSTLLAEVLNSSTYRENARKFQKIIGKTSGLSMAAGIVERALGASNGLVVLHCRRFKFLQNRHRETR
jgi:UDP:flavonoid glycosyltransferase YjiC (YdhE family)